MKCDYDTSRGSRAGGCFKGTAKYEVVIDYGYEKDTMVWCDACKKRFVPEAKKRGYKVKIKKLKQENPLERLSTGW